jgi:Protein of unknown function (DUF1524)
VTSQPIRRRLSAATLTGVVAVVSLAGCTVTGETGPGVSGATSSAKASAHSPKSGSKPASGPVGSALKELDQIPVKGRAPSTGYTRARFGTAWKDTDHNGCDQRNDILRRDLTNTTFRAGTHGCVVLTGTLADRYTGKTISFRKSSASAVQIDHVVALENAWVTGAYKWTTEKRTALATDPLNLLAVDGAQNESKGSGDAATWLPRKSYRCAYVARQVAVKAKYGAWMTSAEHQAIAAILATCPQQKLPQEQAMPPLG